MHTFAKTSVTKILSLYPDNESLEVSAFYKIC